ncbi:MAG: DUF5615 family PIN-like protein [Sedimenticolaceae bacterium]
MSPTPLGARDASVDALHVGDVGLSRAADKEILEYAAQNQRIVITLDADFHTILALQAASSPSVVRLRIEGLNGRELAALLLNIDEAIAEAVSAGAAVSITRDNIRIRHIKGSVTNESYPP